MLIAGRCRVSIPPSIVEWKARTGDQRPRRDEREKGKRSYQRGSCSRKRGAAPRRERTRRKGGLQWQPSKRVESRRKKASRGDRSGRIKKPAACGGRRGRSHRGTKNASASGTPSPGLVFVLRESSVTGCFILAGKITRTNDPPVVLESSHRRIEWVPVPCRQTEKRGVGEPGRIGFPIGRETPGVVRSGNKGAAWRRK